MDAGRLAKLGRRARDVVCAAAVIAMVAHNHFNVRAVRDLGADDEAWYIGGGILVGKAGFPNGPNGLPIPELGPLHCLAYTPLAKLVRSPIDLFYVGWQLRITLLALAIFVVVRLARARWWQALVACFVFVNCEIADVWPFPVHTAALVIAFGVIGASLARTRTAALGSVTIAFAVAGFCRPELLYGYAIALGGFLHHLARTKERSWKWLAVVLAPAVVLFLVFGNPLGGTRAYDAFGQHYTRELFKAEGVTENPWASWPAVANRDFPGATTVGQALRANPGAFFHHVGRNLGSLPRALFHVTRPRLPIASALEYLLWVVGAGVAGLQLRRLLRRPSQLQLALAFAFVCAAVPFLLSVLIVYPRDHYFVVVVVLALLLVASEPAFRMRRWSIGVYAALVGLACVASVCFTATKSDAATLGEWLTNRPRVGLYGDRQRTALELRSLRLEGHIVSLEYAWGTCLYAGYDCEPYLRWEKTLPFDRFVAEKKIAVVVFDDDMARDARFATDEEFLDFVAHPEAHGFELHAVPDTDVRIAVRR